MQQHHPQHVSQHRQPKVAQKQQQQLVQAVQQQPPSKQQLDKMALFKSLVYVKEHEQNNNARPINHAQRSRGKPNLDDFCGGCKWGDGMTCRKQTSSLNEKFSTPIVEAMELVMVQNKKCTNAYYVESINSLGGFCGDCVWGHKQSQTCQAWVEYLMYTYSHPLHEA